MSVCVAPTFEMSESFPLASSGGIAHSANKAHTHTRRVIDTCTDTDIAHMLDTCTRSTRFSAPFMPHLAFRPCMHTLRFQTASSSSAAFEHPPPPPPVLPPLADAHFLSSPSRRPRSSQLFSPRQLLQLASFQLNFLLSRPLLYNLHSSTST